MIVNALYYVRPYYDGNECGNSLEDAKCVQKAPNVTFLQTFNCDPVGIPRLKGYVRAKKQIYRPEYVASHFIHYSTITQPMLQLTAMSRYNEDTPSERFVDEVNEAFMLHAKTWRYTDTKDWSARCLDGYVLNKFGTDKCVVGFPHPLNSESKEGKSKNVNAQGFRYNSFMSEDIVNIWIPKLENALKQRQANYMEKKS